MGGGGGWRVWANLKAVHFCGRWVPGSGWGMGFGCEGGGVRALERLVEGIGPIVLVHL